MSEGIFKRLMNEWRMDSIGVAIFIALTGLAYLLEFDPAMRDHSQLQIGNAELAEKRQTISRLQATMHTVNEQIKTLQIAQASELKLQASTEVNDRLSALSALAGDQGLQVEAIEPGEASGSVRYSTVPMRISGRGKYQEVIRFIRELRGKLPDTSVTEMSLSGGGSDTAATFTLNLLWYAAPAPTVVKNELQ